MGYIAADDILKVREMDLMTYLRNYEPQELVRVSGNTYCTREHESLRISNGKWYWFSHDVGGRSALDYLIKVKDYSFIDAVKTILGNAAVKEPIPYYQKEKVNRNLLMPKLDKDTSQIEKYLYNRGIHPAVTLYCIEKKILYQTAEYHNALFVGYDKEGTPRYGALRATRSPYKGDLTGSNKHFSFSMNENPAPEHIHVFESAIDAMSYATMLLLNGRDWKKETFLSLAGVYKTKREKVVPVALERYLKDYPSIKTVHLHLDNDGIGRGAVAGIVSGLQEKYTVLDEPPLHGKDVNDELKIRVGIMREREEIERYGELTSRFREAERNGGEHLTGYIVFTEDSFTKPYPEAARTYAVSSNNKAFQPNMGGYSIYASALDGSDPMIRLEGYMQSEKGGKDGWKIERCYMKSDEKEMIDVIFGPFFICDCSGPNYGSLNQEQIDRFMKQFENPERLIRMNGTLMSVPYKPEPDLSR